jgi:uncharacterized protein (DUF1810 family)
MPDPFDLERFVQAQQPLYARVREELAGAHKRGHWMWFVFPQLKGLGASSIARTYALASIEEARAYLAHPLLGARLRECAGLLLGAPGADARQVLGYPDDLKLRSSMTLFAAAASETADQHLFQAVLVKFFSGVADPLTRELLT